MLNPSTRSTEAISSPNLTYSIEVKKPISSKIRSTEHTKHGDKNQKPYSKLLIMTYEDIKLTVGVQKSTQEKVQYCLTSIGSNKSK